MSYDDERIALLAVDRDFHHLVGPHDEAQILTVVPPEPHHHGEIRLIVLDLAIVHCRELEVLRREKFNRLRSDRVMGKTDCVPLGSSW